MCAASGDLTIDLGALRENFRIIDSMSSPSCQTGCAVKADAYGLGVARVAPALVEAGAKSFFVATLAEGVFLREVLGAGYTIYVLNGFWARQAKEYRAHHLIPVLNSLPDIKAAQGFAREIGEKFSCALHFDTGMNRLGLRADEAAYLWADDDLMRGLQIVLVMSHFSSSDEQDHVSVPRQYQAFNEITKYYQGVKASLCNSGGVFQGSSFHFDLTRPGIALYGGSPVSGVPNPMRAVVELSAPVLQVHAVAKNETAGYNETYRFDCESAVAVVGAGYADGVLRALSDKGVLYWKGYALPIRGRVSMDLMICDLCNVPEKDYPTPYDMVEIIGAHQSVDDLARAAGTISYEILTSLGARYRRSYIG